ncbi:MAG: S8 family peptidase [Chloroflexi bacterium]|nr:S8 family peptidase [Chloroflexota bacterium]
MEKIAKSLAKAVAQSPPDARLRVIIKYAPGVPPRKVPKSVQALSPERTYRIFPGASLTSTPAQVQALSQDPEVAQLWLDLPVHTWLDTSVPLIRAPQIWDAGLIGRGQKVAIVDTGIDARHPDFGGRIKGLADFTVEGPRDLDGHGTHVAGILAGSGSASGGKYKGVAPGADLYIAKVLDRSGFGLTSQVIAGLEWAMEQEVDVINLSLGGEGPCDGTDALSEACDLVVERGFVVCVAAGNSGPAPASIGPPGCARLVITVGASTDQDEVADFSSRGPTEDGRIKPDIVLPGVGIISTRAQDTSAGEPVSPHYTASSGTSMATPHASGLAALLLQARPDLTPAQVKSLIMTTAIDLGQRAEVQGAGRGDAYQAYGGQPPPEIPSPQPQGCLPRILQTFHLQRA